MLINATLHSKESNINTHRCVIEDVFELSGVEFDYFKNHLMEDYDFIKENKSKMYCDEDDIRHCIVVLDESSNDGILVDAEGYAYARYTSYIPNVRTELQLEYTPSLRLFFELLNSLSYKYTQSVLENQVEGKCKCKFDDFKNAGMLSEMDKATIYDMLCRRLEFDHVKRSNDNLTFTIANDFLIDKEIEMEANQ